MMAAHHAGADQANAQPLVHGAHDLKSARMNFIVNNAADSGRYFWPFEAR
jgi:hypothetical protein